MEKKGVSERWSKRRQKKNSKKITYMSKRKTEEEGVNGQDGRGEIHRNLLD